MPSSNAHCKLEPQLEPHIRALTQFWEGLSPCYMDEDEDAYLYLYPYTLKESSLSAPFECQWTVPLARMSQHMGTSLFLMPIHLHQHSEE